MGYSSFFSEATHGFCVSSDSESDSDVDGSSTRRGRKEESNDHFDIAELAEEISDLRDDKERFNRALSSRVVTVEDMKNGISSVCKHRYQAYGAMRRLLEACSSTLEVLSFYHKSNIPIMSDVFLPPMPQLRHLSIGLPPAYYGGFAQASEGKLPLPLYPSLKVLRLLGWYGAYHLWKRAIHVVPDSKEVIIVSVPAIYQ